jgi:hypothetical protein
MRGIIDKRIDNVNEIISSVDGDNISLDLILSRAAAVV